MNEEHTIDLPLQTRADVRLEPETVDAAARTIEVVWSTGAAVSRRDLFTGRRYDEVLSLDPGHVDLARLNAGAPPLERFMDPGMRSATPSTPSPIVTRAASLPPLAMNRNDRNLL